MRAAGNLPAPQAADTDVIACKLGSMFVLHKHPYTGHTVYHVVMIDMFGCTVIAQASGCPMVHLTRPAATAGLPGLQVCC
jgi:hypothetical protein